MKTAYITLDLINDIVHKEGQLSFSAENFYKYKVLEKTNQAIDAARSADFPIGHVVVGFSKGYPEIPPNSPMFNMLKQSGKGLLLGEWGTQLHSDLHVEEEDFIIIKNRINPFYQTLMLNFLQGLQIQHVVLSGVSTNFVVNASVLSLHDMGYYVTVLSDACATSDDQVHQVFLNTFKGLATVCTVDEWVHSL